MDWSCGNDTKFKDQIWPCPLLLWPLNQQRSFSGRYQYICEVSLLYVKRKRSYCTETTFLQTDRQMDIQILWNQYTSTSSLAGVYKLIFNVEKSLKNDPPGSQNFMGGSHFFTTSGSKFNVKIWTVSAFNDEKWPGESFVTLKNDPGSHFSTGSLFNVTPVWTLPSIVRTANEWSFQLVFPEFWDTFFNYPLWAKIDYSNRIKRVTYTRMMHSNLGNNHIKYPSMNN